MKTNNDDGSVTYKRGLGTSDNPGATAPDIVKQNPIIARAAVFNYPDIYKRLDTATRADPHVMGTALATDPTNAWHVPSLAFNR